MIETNSLFVVFSISFHRILLPLFIIDDSWFRKRELNSMESNQYIILAQRAKSQVENIFEIKVR